MEANRQQALLSDVVREAIREYLDSRDEEYENTPDEKIESDLRQALHEARTGRTVPAREVLAAIRSAKQNADQN